LPGDIIGLAVIGVFLLWAAWAAWRNGTKARLALSVMSLSALFAALYLFIGGVVDYLIVIKAYNVGKSSEVEGEVTNYVVEPKLNERFSVGGVSLLISPSPDEESFYIGHYIKNGLFVKIRYVDKKIIRLETCER
jgi:hypothetical protein